MSQEALLTSCKTALDQIAEIVAPGETITYLDVLVSKVRCLAVYSTHQIPDPDSPGIVLPCSARVAELEAFRLARIGEPPLSEVDAENCALRARVEELEAGHPEWMKRIQRERKEERERIIAHLGTAFLGFVAHDPEKHLFMVGTENIRAALESMP